MQTSNSAENHLNIRALQSEWLLVCEEWRYNLITSFKKDNIKEEILVALNKKDKRKAKDMQRDVCG